MPRIVTPMVAPTWRIAVITAEPTPLRSADRTPSAAFIAAGIAIPAPRPMAANQPAAKPVPLCTVVQAPTASPAAISTNPGATKGLAVDPAGLQPGTGDHAHHHAADQRKQPHSRAEVIEAADLQPPRIGPMGKLTKVTPTTTAIAFGRSRAVNMTGSTDRDRGSTAAAAAPASGRPGRRHHRFHQQVDLERSVRRLDQRKRAADPRARLEAPLHRPA
ncbi:MAG TPA: hypothetical protein VLW50_19610 [Streptosporangiaceae bacterium]|nr:hypothetical protein [Streptosporangiaceae bacterium]